MRKFVAIAFLASFVFGYALGSPPLRIFGALGVALALTLIGWFVALKSSRRWGAAAMAALMAVNLIGRLGAT